MMKYILLIGRMHDGKSTTINEVCKRLTPTEVKRLNGRVFDSENLDCQVENGTYLLLVSGKWVLVVAGSPTEQGITITVLIQICIELEIRITLAIVAMRSMELKAGFDTKKELLESGECILEMNITKIEDDAFRENPDWQDRIERIVQTSQRILN